MNLDLYRRTFVHRGDVFAEQHEDGHYEPVRRVLTDDDIAAHLEGFVSYGVYVIDPTERLESLPETGHKTMYSRANTVHYVMFDLDTYDAEALDFLTRSVERLVGARLAVSPEPYGSKGMRCLLLEDSGGKGYHVWLLLDEPVSAARARAWAETIRPQYEQQARLAMQADAGKWPALEIFPKQDTVPEGGYGNLVKLPFGVHAVTHAQAIPVRRAGWALTLEDVVPFPGALIPETSPQRPERSERSGRAPFACVSKLLESGAPSGCRDNAMYHLARYAVGTGLPDDLVGEWCERVNLEFDPPMTEQEVRVKVRSACSATTAHPGCSADWLRDFCPGGAQCYAPWNDRGSGTGARAEDTNAYPSQMTAEERKAWRQAHEGE